MNLKYKIIEAYPQQHSIVVRYYTDVVTEALLAVQVDEKTGAVLRGRTDYHYELPVPTPTGTDLEAFISLRAPREWLATQEAVLNPQFDTAMGGVMPLVGVEQTVVAPASATPVAPVNTTPENIETV